MVQQARAGRQSVGGGARGKRAAEGGVEGVIAALYVQADGCYAGLPGVDPWPIAGGRNVMSGASATAAYRIVGREVVTFSDDDDEQDVATGRSRNSWSPRFSTGVYEAIKPDASKPMEDKGARKIVSDSRPYPEYLAKVFISGVAIFLIGCTLFVANAALTTRLLELAAWTFLAVGAAVAMLSLLRAQDLVRRQP